MLQQTSYIGRSVLPHGETGAAIGVPADIRRDVELVPGQGGDVVDIDYDREERTMTIHFPEK